ncbi:aldose 1-epimerase family protein [Cellulosilyticum sp. I15G10I2]|uniref:aldose 1-epimerase family protein n=1 Tax=Cellulosilyticum sp. I15G10I2 TaxID=1892843 RepID=UPI00085BCC51|nr:aldose 1-epimerase family protein [Cellulosilyticum sp. I15G10I2]
MNYELKNQYLTVTVTTLGAELISLKDVEGTEYIWNADEKYWKRHTPILFPIVGKIREGKYTLESREYSLPAHGFARDLEFEIESYSKENIVFVLRACKETKKSYPFDFVLRVIYTLKVKRLDIAYEVINEDKDKMYFKIGAHPGFRCPIFENETAGDYYLEFEQEEDALQIPIDSDVYLTRETRQFKGKKLYFNEQLPIDGVIILTNYKSKSISLSSKQHNKGLSVDFEGFPFLGVWRAEDNAPFICIEPWYGHADFSDESKELADKKDTICLESMKTFKCAHGISII